MSVSTMHNFSTLHEVALMVLTPHKFLRAFALLLLSTINKSELLVQIH